MGSLPGPNTFNQITPFADVEIFDNVSKTIGRHTLKFGPQIRINRNNEWLRPQQTYDYGSVSDLENNNVFVLQKIGFPGFVGNRNSNWDFYVQDDWKVNSKPHSEPRPALRLQHGVEPPVRTRGRISMWRRSRFCPPTSRIHAPKGDCCAPRRASAWDPMGKGKTVIHGYAGLFYNPMHFNFATTSNVPALASYNVNVFQAIFANPSIFDKLSRRPILR